MSETQVFSVTIKMEFGVKMPDKPGVTSSTGIITAKFDVVIFAQNALLAASAAEQKLINTIDAEAFEVTHIDICPIHER